MEKGETLRAFWTHIDQRAWPLPALCKHFRCGGTGIL